MSFLEGVDGRERVWNRTKKPAGAAEALNWKKTSVTTPATSTTYSFFLFLFLQFLLQLLQLLPPELSSFPSFPLLLIVVHSYFHPHLDLPPHCSFFTMLVASVRAQSFSPLFLFRWCSSSFSLRVISFFFFSLSFFSFLDFIRSFFFRLSFFFWLLLLSTFFDSRFISLLILVYVSRLLNLDARSRCLHNNFPNKTELVFGIWNGVLWYARGSRINCYGIYVILINV